MFKDLVRTEHIKRCRKVDNSQMKVSADEIKVGDLIKNTYVELFPSLRTKIGKLSIEQVLLVIAINAINQEKVRLTFDLDGKTQSKVFGNQDIFIVLNYES